MSIVNKAVKESRDVARLAVDAAKSELIEQLTPAIQAIVDSKLRRGVLSEDVEALEGVNRMRQKADGYDGISDFEEGKEMGKKNKDKMESVASLFPGVNEMAEGSDEDMDEAAEEQDEATAIEYESADMAEGSDEEMDESIEISESELEAMYAEALQLEVDVSKGFKEMTKPHELGAGAKNNNTTEPGSLEKLKGGEHDWDDEVPPHKQDWIPENLRRLVKQGMAENQALAHENRQLRETVQKMYRKLKETNLLNSKIMHVNKFVTANRLTAEQKRAVIESIDKATSVNEVKRIYTVLESSFRVSGGISESARRPAPRADSQKRRFGGAPNPKVLRESAGEGGGDNTEQRWKQLAGLVNG